MFIPQIVILLLDDTCIMQVSHLTPSVSKKSPHVYTLDVTCMVVGIASYQSQSEYSVGCMTLVTSLLCKMNRGSLRVKDGW